MPNRRLFDLAQDKKGPWTRLLDEPCPHDHLAPQRGNALTLRAALRRDRVGKALRETKRHVQRGWREPRPAFGEDGSAQVRHVYLSSPDEERLEKRIGLAIDEDITIRHDDEGREYEHRGWRVRIPPRIAKTPGHGGRRGGSPLAYEIETWIRYMPKTCDDVDEAIEYVSADGRRVHHFSYFDRVLQRLLVDLIEPHVESTLPSGVHGYRPRRGVPTALRAASQSTGDGYPYALSVDIKRFFERVPHWAIVHALRMELPGVSERIREALVTLMVPHVIRRPEHQDRVAGRTGWWSFCPTSALPTGAIAAPVISNLVLSHYVDKPLQTAAQGKIRALRYSDNILLLGSDRVVVEEAATCLSACLGLLDLELHQYGSVRDLRRDPVSWLGAVLHGKQVQCCTERLERDVRRLCAMRPGNPAFRSRACQLHDYACLATKTRKSLDSVYQRLRAKSPATATAFSLETRGRSAWNPTFYDEVGSP